MSTPVPAQRLHALNSGSAAATHLAECLAVARADGVALPGDVPAAVRGLPATMPGQFSSTAQDLALGKPSEIDHLNGYVVRRGEALGVPVPLNRTLQVLVRLAPSRMQASQAPLNPPQNS